MSSLLEITPSTIVARLASGDLKPATPAEVLTLIGVSAGADVTGAANVIAALDGAPIPVITPVGGDKVLLQDVGSSDALGYATITQILALGGGTYATIAALVAAPDAPWIFNESAGDFDWRAESVNSTHLLFLDAGNDRVSISNVGIAGSDGLLHIISATAGAVTASLNADEVVIEGTGDIGLSFLSDAASGTSCVTFGDPINGNDDGIFRWSQQNRVFEFDAKGVARVATIDDESFTMRQRFLNFINTTNVPALVQFGCTTAQVCDVVMHTGTAFIDYDSRWQGSGGDGLTDGLGRQDFHGAGLGIANTAITGDDGFVHIQTGSAGTISANGGADELVIEGSASTGITVFSGNTSLGGIWFSDDGNNLMSGIYYDHNTDIMTIRAGGVDQFTLHNTAGSIFQQGLVVNETATAGGDFRAEGGTNANLIMADASLDAVGIGAVAVSGSILTINTLTSPLEFITSVYNGALTTPPTVTTGYITVEIGGTVCYIPAYTAIPT